MAFYTLLNYSSNINHHPKLVIFLKYAIYFNKFLWMTCNVKYSHYNVCYLKIANTHMNKEKMMFNDDFKLKYNRY